MPAATHLASITKTVAIKPAREALLFDKQRALIAQYAEAKQRRATNSAHPLTEITVFLRCNSRDKRGECAAVLSIKANLIGFTPPIMRPMRFLCINAFFLCSAVAFAQQTAPPPIIDMHLHAWELSGPSDGGCVPLESIPAWDAKQSPNYAFASTHCTDHLKSPGTSEELMKETLKILDDYNITAVANGDLETVERWKKTGNDRILPATYFDPRHTRPSQVRKWIVTKRIVALAEVGNQYYGIAVNSPLMEPFYALAEELDVPIGIHMGPGPPGVSYSGAKAYRARLSSLLLLEEVLTRHPKLRLWAMHAGWPLAGDAIATLYAHPQLYVDIGGIDFFLPRAEFYSYLKSLVDAGFESRIMFGSDLMTFPGAVTLAIQSVQAAPFLTAEQKRDIFYNNAARFLRLERR